MIRQTIENIRTFIDRHDLYKYMPFINVGLAIIIIFVFISLITYRDPSSFSVNDYEKEIQANVKKYIADNNITIEEDDERFFSLAEIDYTFPYGCFNEGGVNVRNVNGELKYDVYFVCSDNKYSSGIRKLMAENEKNSKFVSIKGNVITFSNTEIPYNDNGYDSKYDVSVDGNVGTEKGMYVVTYNASDGNNTYTSKRVVIVTNNISKSEDDLKSIPEIVLAGSTNFDIDLGTPYVEPGYKATDLIDGDLTSKVRIDGKVETGMTGTYTLTYTVTNSSNNSTTARRVVTVKKPPSNVSVTASVSPTSITNKPVKIYIVISGNGYQKMVLPNYTTVISKVYEYEAQNNGKYIFTIYNQDGSFIKKEVVVSNIDKTPPVANCTLKGEKLRVQASDANGIEGYSYLVNGSYTDFTSKSSYNLTYVQTAYVRVKDKADNISTISCANQEAQPTPTPTNNTPYKDAKGYDCISPYICYKQGDYKTTYYALSKPGPVSSTGCLPTSLAIIASGFQKKDKSGKIYTPDTLIKEVIYSSGKVTCCSNYNRAKKTMKDIGLNAGSLTYLKGNENQVINHLKLGYPVLIHASRGDYTRGGHYLVLLAINDKGQVFLSDPGRKRKTSYTGKPVNNWTTIDTLKAGGVNWFMTVGP